MNDVPATTAPAANNSHGKTHWAVQMNHRNRTWGFLMLWVMIAMHIGQKSPTWQEWAVLSATYLLYPQLAWLVARRSSKPVQQELMHMRLDALLCGIWTAALHFPLWIGFTLFISVVVNLTLFHGLRGLAESMLSWLLGAVVAVVVHFLDRLRGDAARRLEVPLGRRPAQVSRPRAGAQRSRSRWISPL